MHASDPAGEVSPGEFRSIAFGNQRAQAQDPDDCPHCGSETRRFGRGDPGDTHAELVCARGHTVAHDVAGVDRGRGLATDGGKDVERHAQVHEGASIEAKLKRGTGTRDQDTLKLKGKGATADEAADDFERALERAEEGDWGDRLRSIQPGDEEVPADD